MLGALTVSTLRGESGYQRKEIDKLVHWLGRRAGARRRQPAQLDADRAGRADSPRCWQRPIVVTLQGDDLFLDGLTEPYKTQALELIRQQVADVDLFVSVSEYYTDYMTDYLRIPQTQDAHGAARRRLSKDFAPPAPLERDAVHDRLFRAHRARERAAQPGRGVSHPAPGARACRHRGSSPPATWAPISRRISRASSDR